MRCASLAVAAAVVVVNIFPDDDDDDLTPKQPPRSSHKEEEEDKEIARRHTVALKEEDEEDLLPKRENASFREMNICVCFCVVLSCDCVKWCNLFHYKDRSIVFVICALIVIFGREFSLSTLTFHFFINSFINFFIYTLLLLLLFTRGTVGRRVSYIVNDRGLGCFSVSRTRRT